MTFTYWQILSHLQIRPATNVPLKFMEILYNLPIEIVINCVVSSLQNPSLIWSFHCSICQNVGIDLYYDLGFICD